MRAARTTISILALAAAPQLAGCGVGEASVAEEATAAAAVPVEVSLPHRADIHATYKATATITTDADAPVVARVAGEIIALHVEEGDFVEEGDVLAQLDDSPYQVELEKARANLKLAEAEQGLSGALGRLFALAEAYPDLKANQNMMQLSEELTTTENKVAFARQAYNDSVMDYNTLRESFPNNLFAGWFNFRAAELLEIEDESKREVPKVSF